MNREAVRRPCARVSMERFETAAMEGSASPRKPSVPMCVRSPSGILEVAWRSMARMRSCSSMPHPSSITRISLRPPSSIATSMRLAPGVERVFDQLLDGGAWPLDHFAGGDAVDKDGIETANGHERFFFARRRDYTKGMSGVPRDFAQPNLLFFGNPRGGRRPASARWPSQSFSSGRATLKTRLEESVQLKPSFIANTLASETPPSL